MTPEQLYYPGGHFLGLSCVNSQTNIKSCINLSRICEVGANMSQRKEDVLIFERLWKKYICLINPVSRFIICIIRLQ